MPPHSVSTESLFIYSKLSDSKNLVTDIAGTTSIFISLSKCDNKYIYIRKEISSARILYSDDIIAIETLQYQKKK